MGQCPLAPDWYSCLKLAASLISLAAKNCLTAHANTNSGATIIQNINSNRFHRACHLLCGGTFGWTAVHAHRIVVDKQLHIIPNKSNATGAPLALYAEKTENRA